MTFVFVLAPALCILLIQIALWFLDLPMELSLFGYVLYFIIPFYIFRAGLEYGSQRAARYSAIVPAVVITVEIPMYFLFGAGAA